MNTLVAIRNPEGKFQAVDDDGRFIEASPGFETGFAVYQWRRQHFVPRVAIDNSNPAPTTAATNVTPKADVLALQTVGGDALLAGKGHRIADDVLDVLERCRVEGVNVYLPLEQLERKLYERVNEVLKALGGKWVGGKTKAHVFTENPAPLLEIAVATGTYMKPQDFGYFPTQQNEVARAIALADLRPGQRGYEPSAGQGAIAIEMARVLGFENVDVVELLPGNARKLTEAGFVSVVCKDFLSIEPTPIYDRIVMNPPFSGLADVAHIQHALRFLTPEGRLVAISSPSWTFNSARKAEAFRDFVADCDADVQDIAAGAFKAAGTEIATKLITFDAENLPWYREGSQSERMRG